MMANQYLVLQNNALQAQLDISKRRMGYEIEDVENPGSYISPFQTIQPFQIIEHPTTDFSAIVIPEKIPYGMKYGEDWSRGKSRDYDGETVRGRPSRGELTDRLWPTNRPLKDEQYMIDNGWFS